MRLIDFDYSYPPDLIALHPPLNREDSRLMVVNREAQSISHKNFRDIASFFETGEVLILNNSKVFPCRLFATRASGGKVELFLIREKESGVWECLLGKSKRVKKGEELTLKNGVKATVLDDFGDTRQVCFATGRSILDVAFEIGEIPLPPYIDRDNEESDLSRYQTVYAGPVGSVAAPTAGFHMTEGILHALREKGVKIRFVTLHVGLGTFLPIRSEVIEDHVMHGEYYDIPAETAADVNEAKKKGIRVTVVGTTATRALESAWEEGGLKAGPGYTEKFITPPYRFNAVDRLITNFHQPKSTLLVLVSAFAGREFMLSAYAEAILNKYRLFSYGDAMLIE